MSASAFTEFAGAFVQVVTPLAELAAVALLTGTLILSGLAMFFLLFRRPLTGSL